MFAVLSALLFALGPVIDPCACRYDEPASFVGFTEHRAAMTNAGLAPHVIPDDAGDHCSHGHCHQSAAYMPAATDLTVMFVALERPSLPRTAAPPLDPQFDLMRPPRA